MSFLAPLYLLGGLAVSLPVLLHLIRRTPRGRQPFSSLLFLSPSPPRITRRSRIEHWLLLALRAAAIILLAAAFARPFLRASASLLLDGGPGRQVALLVDTSASMQRSGVWTAAVARANRALDQLGPNDLVALYQFDSTTRMVVGFPENGSVDRQAHQELVRKSLQQLAPTWQATNLGRAMTSIADVLTAARRDRGEDHPGQIIVISDCQQGADLAALQGYEWPADVLVTVELVPPSAAGNASVRLLANTAEVDLRARIANSADATNEEFRLGWVNGRGELVGSTEVYVPAGQTRVVKVDERPAGADRLRLLGDQQEFDNEYFVAPFVQHPFAVLFLGDDSADDPRGLRYFLGRVWDETPRRKVTIVDRRMQDPLAFASAKPAGRSSPQSSSPQSNPPKTGQPEPELPEPDLIVSIGVSSVHRPTLQGFLESGGTALLLAVDAASSQAIAEFLPGVSLADSSTQPSNTNSRDQKSYALLSDLDLTHPILEAFSDPRFGDFTKVRFWNHQRLSVDQDKKPGAEVSTNSARPISGEVGDKDPISSETGYQEPRVLARFDDGFPALIERPVGRGRVYVFTSSWRPEDSQLALSSKFVPLMASMLDQAAGVDARSSPNLTVGQPITLPELSGDLVLVSAPDGTQSQLPPEQQTFAETNTPGTYRFQQADESHVFAVNLPAAESETLPVATEQLEQLGVRIGAVPGYKEQLDRERQLRDIELESRQKLWQWLIVAVMGILGIETFVAARAQSAGARHDVTEG